MQKKKLSDLIYYFNGKEPTVSENGVVPVINIGESDGKKCDKPISDKPLIAIGAAGTIGKPRYFDSPVWITSTQIYIQPKEGVDLRFIFAILDNLEWDNFKEPYSVRGALNSHKFLNFEIQIPTLNEQKEIASKYFDYLDEIRREEEIIRGLKQFKASCLDVMFPHEEKQKNVVFDRL